MRRGRRTCWARSGRVLSSLFLSHSPSLLVSPNPTGALTLPTSDSPTRQAQHSLLASASATPSAAQQARERATAHYATAGDKFVEMLQNLQEGLAFYAKLGKLLGELRDACRSVRWRGFPLPPCLTGPALDTP